MEMDEQDEGPNRVRLSTLEKAVVTILTSVVLTILGWIALTVNDSAKAIAVLQNRLDYIGGDAKKALEMREDTETAMRDHEVRILRLEMLEGLPLRQHKPSQPEIGR